ncbi:proton-conducting transporter membrane subunit [Thiocystis violascens]|uniref:Formate hydrogenlyase subunit 3/multisubunit Na+/H+ antiporter, MnhD subunit n=1 Tax=Thiocystis violascens (strain ATCC 17096 / DSM 198 / 6111) TaxID=765911 RepID=I3YH92_THIV6|nr:proton-conducting transporter membrane subunit [Thiocystis violascens]AFL76360.1 formate hydrogenlyase subunit 3/multisubunit Na+/H+ antiporter, MnhD subunit [Thiocystis violascens DSM 198]
MIANHAGTFVPTAAQLVGLDGLAIGLLLVGLGVKAGMVPLHLWLPLAHPAAPIAASAVLSGTMIKVAILGWLRFLPVGAVALADWGAWLSAVGLLTMFFALPIGMTQSDPKVILAYSSVSKMGLLMLLLGLILSDPALAPVGIAAITLYAAYHALVKGGLFLGVGLRKSAALAQPLVLGGLVILALALAGAPLTSGAVTKYGIKPLLDAANWTWLAAAVALSAVATTLLMARFLWISVRSAVGLCLAQRAWALLITLVLLFPFLLGKPGGLAHQCGNPGGRGRHRRRHRRTGHALSELVQAADRSDFPRRSAGAGHAAAARPGVARADPLASLEPALWQARTRCDRCLQPDL